jgi:hypothetical protein
MTKNQKNQLKERERVKRKKSKNQMNKELNKHLKVKAKAKSKLNKKKHLPRKNNSQSNQMMILIWQTWFTIRNLLEYNRQRSKRRRFNSLTKKMIKRERRKEVERAVTKRNNLMKNKLKLQNQNLNLKARTKNRNLTNNIKKWKK